MNLSVRNSLASVALLGLLVLAGCGRTDTTAPTYGNLAEKLDGHLVVLDNNGTFKPYTASLKDVKYLAIYHSAAWCAPCKIFTPKLVKFYNDFKPSHPNFELVFVSHDPGVTDMLGYMKDDAMTWPAVRFEDIDATKVNDTDPQGGMPDLILTDASGKVLSDTFQGDNFVGPDKVLDDIKSIVH